MPEIERISRQEEAFIAVGNTEISKKASIVVTILFLALLVSVPVSQLIFVLCFTDGEITHVLNKGGIQSSGFKFLPTSADIIAFERYIEDASVFRQVLLPRVQALLSFAGLGNNKVILGKDGWLFYEPCVEYVNGKDFTNNEVQHSRIVSEPITNQNLQPDPAKAIIDFHAELEAQDIELIVFPAPAKPSIYPEMLAESYTGFNRPLQNKGYQKFISDLEAAGITVFHADRILMRLKEKTSKALYLKSDTHWTPEASDYLASELAQFMFDKKLVSPGNQQVKTEMKTVTSSGDIKRMLNLLETNDQYPDETVSLTTRIIDRSKTAEVLFLGDSFANIYSGEELNWGESGGIVENLEFYLRKPVDRIVQNDNGSYATRRQLSYDLSRGKDLLKRKKVLIFEFAARELSFGDWQLFDYRIASKVDSQHPAITSSAIVKGEIVKITRPPERNLTVYDSAIIALQLHVTELNSQQTDFEIILYTFGMIDGEYTAASKWEVGQQIEKRIVPWKDVENKKGSILRVDLEGPEVLTKELFWIEEGTESFCENLAEERTDETNRSVRKLQNNCEADVGTASFNSLVSNMSRLLKEEGARAFTGLEGWCFLSDEIHHLAKTDYVSQTIPAISDFNNQLKAGGITLIIVMVPPKSLVYPDKLGPEFRGAILESSSAIAAKYSEFEKALDKEGIKYIDLISEYIEARKSGIDTFLKTDSHWSPEGMQIAARAVDATIRKLEKTIPLDQKTFSKAPEKIVIKGDLLSKAGSGSQCELVTVLKIRNDDGSPLEVDRQSPVLLIGDSHTLVYSEGDDLHTTDAGIYQQLAYRLGITVDRIGIRGSGATSVRIALARRRDKLAGKSVVIWCFASRELTESTSQWNIVPVM